VRRRSLIAVVLAVLLAAGVWIAPPSTPHRPRAVLAAAHLVIRVPVNRILTRTPATDPPPPTTTPTTAPPPPTPTTPPAPTPAPQATQVVPVSEDEALPCVPDFDYAEDAITTATPDWNCIRIGECGYGAAAYSCWSGAYGTVGVNSGAWSPAAQDAYALGLFNGVCHQHFSGCWNDVFTQSDGGPLQ
jgi:hypothetical protein